MKTILLAGLLLISTSTMAFDLKKLVTDAVKDATEDMVEDIVDDLIPSLEDFKVEKAKSTPDTNWVETNQAIVAYTTKGCGYCVRLRKFLDANDIPYIEKDVNAKTEWRTEFQALGGKGVPLSFVKNNRVSGFSESNWKQLLSDNGFI